MKATGPDTVRGARDAAAEAPLSDSEIRRYSRHLILSDVGMAGQRRLKQARVLIVGAGGLGSPLALYLAAAGVGTLGMVDFDVVDESNLQRQVLHGTRDVGRPKLDSAADRIADVNPHVVVERHDTRLTSENALEIIAGYDIVADGTDNFQTRYLVNDACVILGKQNVYGSIFRFDGQVSVFCDPSGPCYRCLFPEPPPPGLVPSCAEGGVLGVLPGIVGTLQAAEVIKLVVGIGDPLIGRLVSFDALSMSWRELTVKRSVRCPVCGPDATIRSPIDYDEFCGVGGHAEPPPAAAPAIRVMQPAEYAARHRAGDPLVLVDVRDPHEWDITNLADVGARLMPLGTFAEHLHELDPASEIVVHCRSGARSAKAVAQLVAAGYPAVWTLAGGVLAWSDQVDPAKPKY